MFSIVILSFHIPYLMGNFLHPTSFRLNSSNPPTYTKRIGQQILGNYSPTSTSLYPDAFFCFCEVLLPLVTPTKSLMWGRKEHIAHPTSKYKDPAWIGSSWIARESVSGRIVSWEPQDVCWREYWLEGELRDLNTRAWNGEKGQLIMQTIAQLSCLTSKVRYLPRE